MLQRQMKSVDTQLQTMSSVPRSSGEPTQPRRETPVRLVLLDITMFRKCLEWMKDAAVPLRLYH
jgi:hypothetical protein